MAYFSGSSEQDTLSFPVMFRAYFDLIWIGQQTCKCCYCPTVALFDKADAFKAQRLAG